MPSTIPLRKNSQQIVQPWKHLTVATTERKNNQPSASSSSMMIGFVVGCLSDLSHAKAVWHKGIKEVQFQDVIRLSRGAPRDSQSPALRQVPVTTVASLGLVAHPFELRKDHRGMSQAPCVLSKLLPPCIAFGCRPASWHVCRARFSPNKPLNTYRFSCSHPA
jgi:hypothetical protein